MSDLKTKLHPRSKHRGPYDFKKLIQACPNLAPFVVLNKYQTESIDFANATAVKMLNKALLQVHYGIQNWDIPPDYLCPPIPGRADYIHHIADLLASSNHGKIPKGKNIQCLDIGVGANCVYPIIGNKSYAWSFIGSDIDPVSIASAGRILESNPDLKNKIELRLQKDRQAIFQGIWTAGYYVDVTICNPPFHASLAEVQAASTRKLSNLNRKKITKSALNFGGQHNELWCEGGEQAFIKKMILESQLFHHSCFWFSTLVSQKAHLSGIYEALKASSATEVKTIAMEQGNKISRIVAWTFLNPKQQQAWAKLRWK